MCARARCLVYIQIDCMHTHTLCASLQRRAHKLTDTHGLTHAFALTHRRCGSLTQSAPATGAGRCAWPWTCFFRAQATLMARPPSHASERVHEWAPRRPSAVGRPPCLAAARQRARPVRTLRAVTRLRRTPALRTRAGGGSPCDVHPALANGRHPPPATRHPPPAACTPPLPTAGAGGALAGNATGRVATEEVQPDRRSAGPRAGDWRAGRRIGQTRAGCSRQHAHRSHCAPPCGRDHTGAEGSQRARCRPSSPPPHQENGAATSRKSDQTGRF